MNLCNDTVLPPKQEDNKVVCNCSFPGGVCHVVAISLWANYLSGNIPPEWADTKLEFLTLSANNLSGELPLALANLIRLKEICISLLSKFLDSVFSFRANAVGLAGITSLEEYLNLFRAGNNLMHCM
uniref:Leucine-rich repeat-containing N-terminal plant-type domain-containing protein n=1 Tax=Salix viminalis TaxID=40686 RepID=A0A6N2K968_SALVM